MAYFDGVMVGDTVYDLEGRPKLVKEVGHDVMFIDCGLFDMEGRIFGFRELGRVIFWQPIPMIVPPPKPVRKVRRKGWAIVYHNTVSPGRYAGCIYPTPEEATAHAANLPGRNLGVVEWDEDKE